MAKFLITGSASGIGKATAALLSSQGHEIIGVDLHDAEVQADLSSPSGRLSMMRQVRERTDSLDGVLAAAGVAIPDPITVKINFFGAIATLDGLRPLLSASTRPRAVAVCSTAAMLPNDLETLSACLIEDEESAVRAQSLNPANAYMTSKHALGLWVRRTSVKPEWAGEGILLNAVAPGVVNTPMTEPLMADPKMVRIVAETNPMAVAGFAEPSEIAELIGYLLTFKGHYTVGQIIFADGGTDALMRPNQI